MTNTEKYPAHEQLFAYIANMPEDTVDHASIFGWFGCYYGSVYDIEAEFQTLQQSADRLAEHIKDAQLKYEFILGKMPEDHPLCKWVQWLDDKAKQALAAHQTQQKDLG